MQLGFVTAILPDLSLEEVLAFAVEAGYDCVEVMCWPPGRAERRYAGVTHIDVTSLDAKAAASINRACESTGAGISGLGYYPNPLSPDPAEAATAVEHLRQVIRAASLLQVPVVNSFVGRDPALSIDENWPRFLETWRPLVDLAGECGVRIGIENCPMSFTRDEWPGGKNLAATPAVWQRMWSDVPADHWGLNYDPSHLVWQMMDPIMPLRRFPERLMHIHAKDVRIDRDRLNEVGIMAYPSQFHTPKLPGLGDVDWSDFFSALTDAGYDGPVCVEVEDRAYEGSLEARKRSLLQSARYLRQFIA